MANLDPKETVTGALEKPLGALLSRRQVLRGGLVAAAGLATTGLLAACADDDDDEPDAPAVDSDDDTEDEPDDTDDEPDDEDDEPDDEPDDDDDAPTTDDGELRGGELFYALVSPFDTLDPNVTTFSDVNRMAMHMFDPLIWQPEPGEFIPLLATDWEVNDTADEYGFTFREDVTFHDGTPFTAEAVQFTFDKIIDPETRAQGAFSAIGPYESSDVIDDYQIVVHFRSPFAPFFNSVSGVSLAPGSPAAQEEMGEDYGTNPVGTGPFRFESLTGDNEIRMVRNEDYAWAPSSYEHSGPPHLDAITWRIIPEPATRVAALQSGEVNIIHGVPIHEIAGLEAGGAFQIMEAILPGSGWSLMNNVEKAPMDEIELRRALQYAFDKEGMIQVIWQGRYDVSCSPLTSITFGYDPATCDMYSYDLDMANQLLDDAGWEMGDDGVRVRDGERLVLDIHYRSDHQTFIDLATFTEAQFREIGIEANLVGQAQAGYFDAVRAGEHHIQFWWGPATDPDGVFRTFFHSSNADGGTNRNRYRNDEMDALIDEAAGETDLERRRELYVELQRFSLEEAIMVFFSEPTEIYAHDDSVMNAKVHWSATNPLFYDAWVED
jgi:peptide/nickel transport system substrate-binding protein